MIRALFQFLLLFAGVLYEINTLNAARYKNVRSKSEAFMLSNKLCSMIALISIFFRLLKEIGQFKISHYTKVIRHSV